MKFVLLSFITIFIAIGCTDYKAKVESDTSWSGWFGDDHVSGQGNRVIDLPDGEDEENACCLVSKETEQGWLKVTIVDEGFLGGDGESKETAEPYGIVEVCTNR